ncbi:MAG: hypothetical protein Kow0075_10630 [Salibacteraceae bacterium]
MEKVVYIVFRAPSADELEQIKSAQGAATSEIWVDKSVTTIPGAYQIDSTYKQEAEQALFDRLLNIHHDLIHEGKPLIEWLAYDKLYPWYIVRNQIFRNAMKHAYQWHVVTSVSKNSGGATVVVLSEFAPLVTQSGVVWKQMPRSVGESADGSSKTNFFRWIWFFGLRALLGLFLPLRRGKHYWFYTPPTPVPMLQPDGTLQPGDPVFGYLAQRINNHKEVVPLLVLKTFGKNARFNWSSTFPAQLAVSRCVLFEWFQLRATLSPRVRQNTAAYIALISSVIKKLQAEATGLDRIVLNSLIGLTGQFRNMVINYHASLLLFSKAQPKSIGGGNEHSNTKYPMIAAARKLGIPTYGIQHGGISAQNIFYRFTERDRKFHPWPDLTLAWGAYIIDRLCMQSAYARDEVELVGQLRTDIIPVLKKKFETIRRDKLRVVFLSQPIPHIPDIRARMLDDFYRMKASNPGYDWVLKPHPREYHELHLMEDLASKYATDPGIVTDDLYLVLANCDVVITYYSTAGAEAIYFDKELIVWDFDGADIARYVADGVARLATNTEEIISILKKLQSGELPDLSKNRMQYRDARVYKLDRHCAERIIQTILRLSIDRG